MNSRVKDLILVFLIHLVISLPFYTANVYGFKISNVKVTKITPNSATIEWITSNLSSGKVKYGRTTALGFLQKHDDFVENHTLVISSGIDSNAVHFFAVESTDVAGNTTIDNNSNKLYTFKTTDALVNDSTVPVISDVDALQITDTSARIKWLTNENSTTIVLYGVNKTDKTKSSDALETNHSIIIDGLTKNSNYTFTVKSCDKAKNCVNSSGHSFAAGKDIIVPFINLTLSRFVNRRVIDIKGSTEPFSSVALFVNNLNIPKRSLSNNEVGSSGKFVFSQIQLEQDNVIKIAIADKAGNKNERTFEVGVDTQHPSVELNEIPSRISKPNLTVKGIVNEPVKVRVFADANINESSMPSKITRLNATKIGQNSVELHWDESKDKDFSHYAVYRSDTGAIAVTRPANFNLYPDVLVDSGKSYTYEISAVNVFGNEGPKSEPITVTPLKGGQTLNLKPPEVDILEDFRKPILATNVSGNFEFGIMLKGDAAYNLKLIFDDRADNSVIIEKSVVLDTKKPEIKITSPPSGALLFENVANEIDVIGITKPNARVHLFVERTPFSLFNKTFEVGDLLNDLKNIPDSQLDAKCRFNVASKSFCSTGADFSTTADSQGNFKFEKVDLTAFFGGAGRIREIPVTEFSNVLLNQDAKDSKTTTLLAIATDQTGQRGFATQSIRIGTCWSGNQSWDIIPLTRYQSPTLLSTERFAEGTETIYFYFNYSYIGPGTSAVVSSVSISQACSPRELIDPRFNIGCRIMPASIPAKPLNPPDNTITYSAAQLNRLPGMDKFLEDDWKGFFNAVNKELTFPLKVRITYKHDTDNDGNLETETQTTCEQVSYAIDNTIIDPRKVLPDWLLYDFADILQDSIKTLTQVQEHVNKALDYVAVGCLVSFGLIVVVQFYRRWVSFWEEKKFLVKDKFNEVLSAFKLPQNTKDEESCRTLIKSIKDSKGSFKLSYVNDFDLKRCFPTIDSAWSSEAKVYSGMRYTCDRVFGHAAPAGWTESKSDAELYNKIASGEGCAVDQSVRGQPLRAVKCRSVQLSTYAEKPENFGIDDTCLELTKEKGGSTLYTLGEFEGATNIYRLNYLKGIRDVGTVYAIKRDETNYLTAQQKSCQELCGVKPQQSSRDVVNMVGKSPIILMQDPKSKVSQEVGFACTKVDTCRSFNTEKKITDASGKVHDIKSAFTMGYTSAIEIGGNTPCFYDGSNTGVVSDSPSTREECCCINANEAKITTNYYAPDDVDVITKKPVHESKTGSLSGLELKSLGKDDYPQMKWSYRYWKEKFTAVGTEGAPHNEYHPKRYIEGRDFPACFGQNNWLYEYVLQQPETVLTVDPFKQHEASLQCAHLAGISNRIQFIKNLMSSLRTCLIQVRTTGRGDAGACKELFTQYLCNSIWQVIRWFVDGCIPIGFGTEIDTDDNNIATYARAGFKGIYDSISDLQSSTRQEYGNAKLNEILGTGEESIARKICLGAFGYDWEINARNLVDAAYSTPFATLVQPITRSREFLTVEPGSLKPKYEYRASWIINPGCDFERYDVYLVCAGRKQLDKYPNNINCGAIGSGSIAYSVTTPLNVPRTGTIGEPSAGYSQCDCIQLENERLSPTIFSGRLKQNALEERALPLGSRVLATDVRYDHIKIVLQPDRKIANNIRPNCFPSGYGEGIFYFPLIDKSPRDYMDCRVDFSTGSFICGEGAAFATRKGIAQFMEIKINGKDSTKASELVFTADESLDLDVTIRKIGKDKCLKLTMDGINQIRGITQEGTQQYQVQLEKSLSLGLDKEILSQPGISIEKVSLPTSGEVNINLRFYDTNNDDIIRFDEDAVEIDNARKQIIRGEALKDKKIINQDLSDSKGKSKEVEVSIVDNALLLKKQGAEIKVISVNLPRNNAGQVIKIKSPAELADDISKKRDEIIGSGDWTVTIKPITQTTATPQAREKTVQLTLLHLKDNVDSYSDPSSCDLTELVVGDGDRQQKRDIKIKVVPKSSDASLQGALIKIVSSPSSSVPIKKEDKEFISVSARITHDSGIKDAKMVCKNPIGNETEEISSRPLGNNNFDFPIDSSKIELAGKYKCTITAHSLSEKARVNTESFDFEVMCGEPNNYGLCHTSGNCCKGRNCNTDANKISAGLPCESKS
ncbi:MAG: fibronectin type III domain-containing protein [Nanoarchaeota archaeon]